MNKDELQDLNDKNEGNNKNNADDSGIPVIRKKAAIRRITDADLFPIVKIPKTTLQKYKKIPVSGLASLGTAFSKLPDAARTITQTKTSVMQTSEKCTICL